MQFDLGEDRWDLIVLTYVSPDRNYAPKLVRALRPGGAIVMEDHHVDSRRVWPEGTYHDNDLLNVSLACGSRTMKMSGIVQTGKQDISMDASRA